MAHRQVECGHEQKAGPVEPNGQGFALGQRPRGGKDQQPQDRISQRTCAAGTADRSEWPTTAGAGRLLSWPLFKFISNDIVDPLITLLGNLGRLWGGG